jgi:hypothetical protein
MKAALIRIHTFLLAFIRMKIFVFSGPHIQLF